MKNKFKSLDEMIEHYRKVIETNEFANRIDSSDGAICEYIVDWHSDILLDTLKNNRRVSSKHDLNIIHHTSKYTRRFDHIKDIVDFYKHQPNIHKEQSNE